MKKGTIYLIPTTLGDSPIDQVIPSHVQKAVSSIDHYIVENEKTARHYLKKLPISKPLQELLLYPLNKRTSASDLESYLKPAMEGKDMGVISEAGCPGIADPGAEIVKLAHERHIRVIPMVGPSSILLALMASGFNGQNFAFVGYLPIEKPQRIKRIKELERLIQQQKQTQIFIETPFRNNKFIEDLLQICSPQTMLCIAADITLQTEFIQTKSVAEWKKIKLQDFNKRPAIFLIN